MLTIVPVSHNAPQRNLDCVKMNFWKSSDPTIKPREGTVGRLQPRLKRKKKSRSQSNSEWQEEAPRYQPQQVHRGVKSAKKLPYGLAQERCEQWGEMKQRPGA